MKDLIRVNPEVKKALEEKRAVVALESTIISHGFNYPENLETAFECERIIREQGAIPATIAIVNGEIVIGLNEDEIRMFAENKDMPKCSRRDVANIIAQKKSGATKVATTKMFAELAGVKIIA